MSEDITVLREYIVELGLDAKESLEFHDWVCLRERLQESDEYELAEWINRLGSPGALEEYIKENMPNV